MNILYCGDAGIKDGLLISILSLLKHASETLHIYVLTINFQDSRPLSDRTIKFLDQLAKQTNPKNFVKKIDATEVFVNNLPDKNLNTITTKNYFKPCAMLRLYLDKIPMLAKLDKILYLDYDVVCRKDPAEFYHTDLTNIEAAGVLDIYGKNFYHYHRPKFFKKNTFHDLKEYRPDYMNSGVLLFNMPECLKTDLFPRAVKICQEKRLMLADQAALNLVINRRKILSIIYNDQRERPSADTVFHHFSNNFKFKPFFHVQKIKPFEIDKIHDVLKITEYDDLFAEYQKLKSRL